MVVAGEEIQRAERSEARQDNERDNEESLLSEVRLKFIEHDGRTSPEALPNW